MSYTAKEDEEFFGAIGRLTVSWAQLELSIEGMIDIAYHVLDGKSIEPEKPRALSRKIDFLKSVFKSDKMGSQDVSNFLTLLEKIKHESDTRHDIIHGVVLKHEERSGTATMIRTITKKGKRSLKKYQVTTLSILKAARRAQKLCDATDIFVLGFYDLIDELSQQRDTQKQL